MKVVRLADAFEYPVTGHFDMRALRLHNKETSNTVDYTLGLSHFLPGGGTEYVETGVELIYFILEGEMTVRTKDDDHRNLKNTIPSTCNGWEMEKRSAMRPTSPPPCW